MGKRCQTRHHKHLEQGKNTPCMTLTRCSPSLSLVLWFFQTEIFMILGLTRGLRFYKVCT